MMNLLLNSTRGNPFVELEADHHRFIGNPLMSAWTDTSDCHEREYSVYEYSILRTSNRARKNSRYLGR